MALTALFSAAGCSPNPGGEETQASARRAPPLQDYLAILEGEPNAAHAALDRIENHWHPGSSIMLLELLRWLNDTPASAAADIRQLLTRKLDLDSYDWKSACHAIWREEFEPHPRYAEFKRHLLSLIDFRIGDHFYDGVPATIRLDQIQWGGVVRDGIPPLRQPKMIPAASADWLADDHIVFGIEVNGDARAYPKRILAWHEMFVDTVGDLPLAGVYCTLCGTVVIYETTFDGTTHQLGTSGLLYQSNKLMYDAETSSLWSTMSGEPVVGKLVGQGIQLARRPVVTTTWGEWRTRHPESSVLSLETGFQRDYSENVAYRDYFASADIMFPVPRTDDRLPLKAEVLALRSATGDEALAIESQFLRGQPVYHDRLGDMSLVVLTDSSGAHRAYASGDVQFATWDGTGIATDQAGNEYQVTETALRGPDGNELPRIPSHGSYWFGWYAAFPETRLVSGQSNAP